METGCNIFPMYYKEFSPHIHYAKILKDDSRPEPTKKQHAWHSPEKKNRLRKSIENVSSTKNLQNKFASAKHCRQANQKPHIGHTHEKRVRYSKTTTFYFAINVTNYLTNVTKKRSSATWESAGTQFIWHTQLLSLTTDLRIDFFVIICYCIQPFAITPQRPSLFLLVKYNPRK